MKTGTWRSVLSESILVRQLAATLLLGRAAVYALCGARYRAICDVCSTARAAGTGPLRNVALFIVFRWVEQAKRSGSNPFLEAYLRSSLSRRCAESYSAPGARKHDIYRDLIVLKPASMDEKGVILLKYARTFEAVVALMDFHRLLQRYIFVLEPCWAGYCDPALLMYVARNNPVIVQCFTEEDREFVTRIGWPLVPVRLGPADWVNTNVFQSAQSADKLYDLVMVANWGAHKRHAQLFRALKQIPERRINVLLAGYPWAGRTASDIRNEQRRIGAGCARIDIVEAIPHPELARYLSQCKVFVFLSRKEGDNKALVEAMFADVPAIVFRDTVGGAGSRINAATGIFSTDQELPDKIRFMLDHHAEFTPRAWALENTGSSIATRIVDEAVSRAVQKSGGRYVRHLVEKCNSPNLSYRESSDRSLMRPDYEFIESCGRRLP
jgi:glycosyltransferase involved in cell wall biosynthesis